MSIRKNTGTAPSKRALEVAKIYHIDPTGMSHNDLMKHIRTKHWERKKQISMYKVQPKIRESNTYTGKLKQAWDKYDPDSSDSEADFNEAQYQKMRNRRNNDEE